MLSVFGDSLAELSCNAQTFLLLIFFYAR